MYALFKDGICEAYSMTSTTLEGTDVVAYDIPNTFDSAVSGVILDENGDVQIVTKAEADAARIAKTLRIYDYIGETVDVLSQDFSLLPVRKVSPTYIQGRKVQSEYHNDSGAKVVKKTFSDVIDPSGNLVALRVYFEWFNHDDTVGLSKSQIVKEFTAAEAETVMRERRERSIDHLIAGAKGTPIAGALHMVFQHYEAEIVAFIGSGSSKLEIAVANDTDATIAPVLDTVIGVLSDGVTPYTIRMAILREITELPA